MAYESDTEIVKDYCETKSNRAATAFVRKYQKFVYATALRYLKDEDDADDAAQEVFIKSLKNLHKFRGESSLKTWLYRITYNVSSNILRKKKIKRFLRIDDKEDFLNLPAHEPGPDKQLENNELQLSFMRSLDKLPEKQRETFAMRYFDEMTYEEISEVLGTSTGGLKANYFQAVKKIAKYINKELV